MGVALRPGEGRALGRIARRVTLEAQAQAQAQHGGLDLHPPLALGAQFRGRVKADPTAEARQSLRGESMAMSDVAVALESGFGSPPASGKGFRKKAGMTPSGFKREHRLVPQPS